MKIFATALVTIVFALLLVSYGVYNNLPFPKKIGVDVYFKEDLSSAISTSTDKTKPHPKIINTVKAQEPRIVTHIKTPENIKAVYMSSWVAGAPSVRNRIIKLIEDTELNSVVIDIKDNTGVVSWDGRVKDLNSLIDELHSKNIYLIARISAFQDPVYVKKYPEQAVYSKNTNDVWKDNKGVTWVDSGSKDMWKYLVDISKEAYARGFDEINLDYIRFPTDGNLFDMTFPISGDRAKTDKPGIIGDFYRYITTELHKENIPVSADLFGIIMITKTDIPVLGQDMHTALETFDFVAPMIYPSHFYSGTAGYQNPAANPGEIITFAMARGLNIADQVASSTAQSTSTVRAKFRPWYQDFDMGAVYTPEMVRAQITAGENLGINSWMLWDPANHYTPSALKVE